MATELDVKTPTEVMELGLLYAGINNLLAVFREHYGCIPFDLCMANGSSNSLTNAYDKQSERKDW